MCSRRPPVRRRRWRRAQLEGLINQFLHTLPERECSIFLRRYWYVEEYSAIAKRYHMKLNTVKTSLSARAEN